jgi:hypothetical protein
MRYDPDARHDPVCAGFRRIESSTEVHQAPWAPLSTSCMAWGRIE